MRPLLLFFCLSQLFLFVSSQYSISVGSISVEVDSNINYDIYIDGTLWFQSGPTGIYQQSQWSLNTDHTLVRKDVSPYSGEDEFGIFRGLTVLWSSTQNTDFGTRIRVYDHYVIFDQIFPQGAQGVSSGNNKTVSTSFPSFSQTGGKLATLQYMSFQGNMARPYYGVGLSSFIGGTNGGVPTVFWDEYQTAILSPMDNYFVGFHTYNQTGLGNYLACGIQGAVQEIPSAFIHPTILYYSPNGMNATMYGWGEVLLQNTGKVRITPSGDFAISHLGYWTDNGAFYYYLTVPNTTYEETMFLIKQYYEQQGLPIRYFQLDSWWYYKDAHDAVTVWVARPDIFPSTMTGFVNNFQSPLVLHNRYWSTSSPYEDLFNWASDNSYWGDGGYGLPNDTAFWDFLFDQISSWNMITYEQDWLIRQTQRMSQLQTDVFFGKYWLGNMSRAASEHGVTVQYCMPLPLHVLHSTQCQAVTQIRTSDDYLHSVEQWNIGVNSLLSWSLGLIPFKDVLWSTTYQPGNPKYSNETYESNPEMQLIVAVLSTGPVGIGDQIGKTNISLVKRCCMTDGKILKPDKPATPIDRWFLASGPDGQVWDTFTDFNGLRWHEVLVVDLRIDFDLYPSDLGIDSNADYVMYEILYGSVVSTSSLAPFTESAPLWIPASSLNDSDATKQHDPVYEYHTYFFAPIIEANGWTILGEQDKIVPVSKHRIPKIVYDSSSLILSVRGVPFETTTIDLYDSRTEQIHSVSVSFGYYSIATITCNTQVGICKCNSYE